MAAVPNYSFTPTVFKVPVKMVTISGDTDTAEILTCTGSDEECEIDFASQASLDEAAERATPNNLAGTFTKGSFSLCAPGEAGGSKTIHVKGSWYNGTTTYYTTANPADPVSTDEAEWGETPVNLTTCQLNMKFSSELELTEADEVTITLFPIVTGAAYFLTNSTDTNANCANGTLEAVCVNYPNLIPYVSTGTATATLESYLVAPPESEDFSGASNDAYAMIHLLFDQDGNAFGGMTLQYFRNGEVISPNRFGQAIKEIALNDDGTTYSFQTYGSNPETETYGSVVWSEFTRIPELGESLMSQTYDTSTGSTLEGETDCTVRRVDPASVKDGSFVD